MKKLLIEILGSFKINETGFSSRKLTAFVIVVLVIIIHIKWLMIGTLTELEMVLTIDYAFISALFGMTTFQSLKTFGKEIPKEGVSEAKEDEIK